MRLSRRTRAVLAAGAATAVGLATVTGPAMSNASASPKPAVTQPTVYWAEGPGATPNWIFPYASLSYYDTTNIQDFQQLMYRPLYWLSSGGLPDYNSAQSLANAPTLSNDDTAVTIHLKSYRWSNGTAVDAQSVVFFLNMLRAEKENYAGYLPGELPDNIKSVSSPGATSGYVTIQFTHAVNANWVLFNQLSEITPMPQAWDISGLVDGRPAAPGSGGCSSMTWSLATQADCQKVWTFVTDDGGAGGHPIESSDLATYASNPLWQVVDGPWHLKSFSASSGEAAFIPNAHYSGADKAHVAEFVELPFASSTAEFNELAAGGSLGGNTVGYLPTENTPEAPKLGEVGPNSPELGNFNLEQQFSWSTNYFPINFNSLGNGGEAGAIFRQLYIRQALQELVNGPQILAAAYKNYGVVDNGPTPREPATEFLAPDQRTNLYSYDEARAISTLENHGWSVKAGQADVCTDGAKCGAGIRTGTKLNMTMIYVSGSPALQTVVDSEVTSWAKAGIIVTTTVGNLDQVLGDAVPCSGVVSPDRCNWEMADWGGGWLFEPDVEPTGEYQYETAAVSNSGSYSDPTNDALIKASLTENVAGVFYKWDDYATEQLPVIWQPNSVGLVEVPKNLRGVEPFSALGYLTPEDWSWAS